MNKGDIVLVSFPFTDISGSKNRPAIVLVESENDVLVCFLTTKLKWRDEHDILIEPSAVNGLKVQSLARINKMATLGKELILGRIGTLEAVTQKEMNQSIIKTLRLIE